MRRFLSFLQPQTDPALVRRILDGDERAFLVLYDRHERKVFHLLRRLTSDTSRAEELTQETWVTAYQSLAGWRGEGLFSSWLCGIAVRTLQTDTRRNPRTEALPDAEQDHAAPADPAGDGWAHLSRREADTALENAIAALPDECRVVYVLIRVEQMRYKEAASLLQIPVGTVQSRLHRATRLLLAELAPFLEDAPTPSSEPAKGDSYVRPVRCTTK